MTRALIRTHRQDRPGTTAGTLAFLRPGGRTRG